MSNETYVMPSAGFVREKDLLSVLSIGRTTLARWVESNRFPAAVNIGVKAKGWNVEVVRAWIAERSSSAKK
ncbi:transcriptional regulator, AlpA family [Burkholderia sp. D7]|nr:transcriptional regulator, AlpA family [Burkholderia sp. D7]